MQALTRPDRPVNAVFLHCSSSSDPETTAYDVETWHKKRYGEGIGYHYFIQTDGALTLGRELSEPAPPFLGHDTDVIAICVNGLRSADFNDHQMARLYDLCLDINEAYEGEMNFYGHCEVSSSSCPVFDYMTILDLDFDGKMNEQIRII